MHLLALFTVLLFTSAVWSPVAFATCIIPENLKEVNWDLEDYGQKWYLVMTTNDPMSHHISCNMIMNNKAQGNTVTSEIWQFSKEYKANSFNGSMVRQPSGAYRKINTELSGEDFYIAEHDAAGHVDQEAVDEINLMLSEDWLIISDSKTYSSYAFCSPQKEWNVHLYTKTTEPTPSVLIAAVNDLRAHGIHVNMHFADCGGALDHHCQACN